MQLRNQRLLRMQATAKSGAQASLEGMTSPAQLRGAGITREGSSTPSVTLPRPPNWQASQRRSPSAAGTAARRFRYRGPAWLVCTTDALHCLGLRREWFRGRSRARCKDWEHEGWAVWPPWMEDWRHAHLAMAAGGAGAQPPGRRGGRGPGCPMRAGGRGSPITLLLSCFLPAAASPPPAKSKQAAVSRLLNEDATCTAAPLS
jgi:hypothetical protein